MTTLLKGLETNEKDNFITAWGKGMMQGGIYSGLVCATIGGIVYVAGKVINKDEVQSDTKVGE